MNQTEMNFDVPPRKDASEVPGQLLEKIKKLLRLASSSNQHEAALAMSRAMALADRANLDLSSLREDDDVGEIVQRWIPTGARLAREKQLALGIVQTFFSVHPVMFKSKSAVVFIGTDADIVIAEYVFEYLTRASRRCLAAYEVEEKRCRRKTTPGKRVNFLAGFFYAISNTLRHQRAEILLEDQKFALVLSSQEKAREQYVGEQLGPTKAVVLRKSRRNRDALESGWRDGKNTSLNPALPTKRAVLLLK